MWKSTAQRNTTEAVYVCVQCAESKEHNKKGLKRKGKVLLLSCSAFLLSIITKTHFFERMIKKTKDSKRL